MSGASNQAAKIRVNYPTGPVEYMLPSQPGETFIVGRGIDASLRFESTPTYGYISNRHCHIIMENKVYKLGDGVPNGKSSTSGTYINGQRLSGGYHTLTPGDTIKLGTRADAVTINFLGATAIQESATMLEGLGTAPTKPAGQAIGPTKSIHEEATEPIARQTETPKADDDKTPPPDEPVAPSEPLTTDPASIGLDYACGVCQGKSFTWGVAVGPKALEFRAEGETKTTPLRARRCDDCGSVVFFAKDT